MSDQYTTQFQAGLGMIEECRLFLELWEDGDTVQVLENKVLEAGVLPNVTARRVRNLIAEMWAPRFFVNDAQPARDLKNILEYLNREAISQFITLFTARAQLIYHDFITQVYWPIYESGRSVISRDEAKSFILEALDEGKMQKRWSESTIHRVTGYLIGAAVDFGFLMKASRSTYEITPPSIHPKLALYLAYTLHFEGLSDSHVLAHRDWKLWGMNENDVLRQLQYLGRDGHFIIQGSVELVRFSWTYKNREELLNAITR
mgnify:CR=1 FL=1